MPNLREEGDLEVSDPGDPYLLKLVVLNLRGDRFLNGLDGLLVPSGLVKTLSLHLYSIWEVDEAVLDSCKSSGT